MREPELASERAKSRVAFGAPSRTAAPFNDSANVESRWTALAFDPPGGELLDFHGIKGARRGRRGKVAALAAALSVIDAAIQIHGGAGASQDTPLARLYAGAHARLADGPDEVHLETTAKMEIRRSKL